MENSTTVRARVANKPTLSPSCRNWFRTSQLRSLTRGRQKHTEKSGQHWRRKAGSSDLKSSQQANALAQLQELVQDIPVEELDSRPSEAYGEIRATLEKEGRLIRSEE